MLRRWLIKLETKFQLSSFLMIENFKYAKLDWQVKMTFQTSSSISNVFYRFSLMAPLKLNSMAIGDISYSMKTKLVASLDL